MFSATIRGATAAILLAGASGLAMAQSDPANPAPPQAGPSQPGAPQASPPPASAGMHNSTTGAASTDVPSPPVVVHIPSGRDAAKFNPAADANDKKPTMAHALGLTDEQRRFISGSIAGKAEGSGQPDFKPEVSALMPETARVQDLPPEVSAKIPWVKPYKYAVVEDKILLVDPVNDNIVLEILNR